MVFRLLRASSSQLYRAIITRPQQRGYPQHRFLSKTIGKVLPVSSMNFSSETISYLAQVPAQKLDEDLMGPLGFSVDQLMELAGLSCACAIHEEYNTATHGRVLVLVGPGNNGGDGLVAARHLHHFGYHVQVCYPKRTDKELYRNLVIQLESLRIPFVDVETVLEASLISQANIVLDGLFGFSFKGSPRAPFDGLISSMARAVAARRDGDNFAVISIDVPSGWNVEEGDVSGLNMQPDMLISLTAPKMCAKEFRGAHHYLGGRFVPPEIVEKYGLVLPKYPGSSMCVKLDNVSRDVSNIRKTYATEALTDFHMHENPMDQFAEWFELAKHCKNVEEPNAMAVASVNSDAQPSVRVVLLRGFSDHGFVFYTNYESRKGKDFEGNPKVAATFYWEPLGMSVRIEGKIQKLSAADSDAYWASRPREHQIGALSSAQSSIIESSEQLLKSYESVKDEYSSKDVIPRPSWWGGYIIQPHSIEFWKGRASRLHDRVIYMADSKTTDTAKHWVRSHLSP